FHSCKREPEPQKYLGNYPLGEVKDYLYFKPGSYWVYECDSTGELDSQVMLSCDTPWIRKSFIDYQFIKYSKYSFPFKTSFNTYEYSNDILYCENCKRGFSTLIAFKSPTNTALDCTFFYPFDSTVAGGGGSSPTYYKGYLDSLQVLGKWYKEVRVFQYGTSGFIRPNYKTEILRDARMTMFWAKNVGVVKYYIQGGLWDNNLTPFWFNWNLKRYSIKK
ncbi:MAG: hypothetical protein EBV15_11660, partial [Bacteroidetes bacterium]|nr:hypothetical protein [Bacteroidota bacterium]